LNLTEPVALVFGNEHNGISDTAVELADANFLIPQVGMIQSLNISVACAVSLYEAFRQRLKKGMYETSQLDENQLKMNLDEWCKK
jgi:tRNA (guanosine-2'-O-)-methyltransferase